MSPQTTAGERWRIRLNLPLTALSIEPTRILIVDDDESTGLLRQLLNDLGHGTTQVASNAETALEIARNFRPSLVFLCLDLPDMNAYDVAQQLRDRAEARNLRLIALTAEHAHAGRDEARQAGFERYLAKPVSTSDLEQLLRAKLS